MSEARRPAGLLLAAAALALAAVTAAASAGLEPFATWYYVFAWYAVLLAADGAIALRSGRFFLLGRPGFAASLFAWSVPFWLVFELFDFRLENWYYVYVPDGRGERWAGIALSYATVLPAILTSERLLDASGVARGARVPALRASPALLAGLQVAGAAMLALALAWPRSFFPLVWGGVVLLADPWVHRRAPARSLLGELASGRAGRPIRLLLGGLAIGFVWEALNAAARGRWIYTVPGFEEGRLFEMPLLGFLGFPPFALGGFAAWQALVVAGAAVPRESKTWRSPPRARAAAALGAAAFSVLVLLGMERSTIASTTPRVADLPGMGAAPAATIERAGWDVFGLAEAEPGRVARRVGATDSAARAWVESARLAALGGIGTEGAGALAAAGVRSVPELARQDPAALARRLAAAGRPVPVARVRVWVRAARESGRGAARPAEDPAGVPRSADDTAFPGHSPETAVRYQRPVGSPPRSPPPAAPPARAASRAGSPPAVRGGSAARGVRGGLPTGRSRPR